MTADEYYDRRDQDKRRINGVLIAILAAIGIILVAVVWKSFQNREPVQIMREAALYGYTTEGVPVIRDDNGRTWEAPWLRDIIDNEDHVMIQISTGESYRDSSDDTIYRTWIETPVIYGYGETN